MFERVSDTNIEKSALAPLNFYQTLTDNPSFIGVSIFSILSILVLDPKVYFPDFLTLVMSYFGSWFGLYILSFNPFKWKKSDTHSNHNHMSDTQNDASHNLCMRYVIARIPTILLEI